MKLPITVKLPHRVGVNQIGDWMLERKILDRISHDWVTGVLSFEDEGDALAFCITFGAERFETTVERMLRIEESHN